MKPTENKPGYFQRFQNLAMIRMAPGVVIEKDSLTYWRVRILFAIIVTGLLIGLFALVPSVALVIKKKLWGLLLVDLVVWPVGISILFSRRLKYEIRAAIALISFYLLGLAIIISVGPLSGGPMWLFAFAVLVGVLLGSKAAIMALTVNGITLTITGWLINAGIFGHTFPFFNTMEAMIATVANFMVLNTIAAISVAVLVKGLISTHEKEKTLYSTLKTERLHLMEAKEKLEKIHERLELAMDAAEHGFWDWNLDTDDIYFSPRYYTMLGYKPGELPMKLKTWVNLMHPDDQKTIVPEVQNYVKNAQPYEVKFRLKTKDGDWKWISGIGKSYEKDVDEIPHRAVGVHVDITDRKQAEETLRESEAKLQRAQKMEAIGILAGGVAHDLNNVLSGIVSYPDLLLMDLPEDSPLRKPILTIRESGQKAASIVQDLLTLARRGIVVTDVINLNQVIDSYLKSLEYEKLKEFNPDAKIESDLEMNLLNIMGSPVHLSKTVMNLVNNAAEAMPGGGNILISTQSKYIDKPIRGYDDVKEGDYVILSVSDTGTGILSEDMERIFEPFYTKKVMGRSGTGLGMAVVWGTVKDHKGYINVQSSKGKGTIFTLYFPVTRREIIGKEKALAIEEYMGKGETILVVDDVKEQLEVASRILKKLGYSAISVSSGEEAVDYMKDNSADLLVLDMIMDPGIDGFETYKRVLELHPGQKAIIASGFSETDRVKEAQRLGAGQYIKKPYTMEKIGIAVKEELEKC